MNSKFSKAVLLIFLAIFSFQTFAQEKPQALKFDEYTEKDGSNLKLLDEKINRFVRKLKKEPQSFRGFVIYYRKLPKSPAKCNFLKNFTDNEVVAYLVDSLKKYNFPRIQVVAETFRDNFEVEFWIVPQEAKVPSASRGEDFHPPCCCPSIKILGNETVSDKTEILTYSVEVTEGDDFFYEEPSYSWKISDGDIVQGQNTKQIKVNLSNSKTDIVNVNVEIGGVNCPGTCPSESSFKTQIKPENPQAVKVDEFDDKIEKIESFTEKTNRFLQKVADSPAATSGVIAIYPIDSSLYQELFQKANSILLGRPELKKRVEVIPVPGARYRGNPFEITEFWIVPQGALPPYHFVIADCLCPAVEIEGEEFVKDFNEPLTFTAQVRGGSQEEVTYKWTISAGEIIKGQNTPIITVDLSKANVENIVVSVEIGGACEDCVKEFKFETKLSKE